MSKIKRSDIAELIVGSSLLAFPIAATEEIWNLSQEIGFLNIGMIAVVSCLFLGFFIYYIHAQDDDGKTSIGIKRVAVTYGITLLVCAAILLMLGKFPLLTDTAIAVKRVILVAFPACFSATVVDSLK